MKEDRRERLPPSKQNCRGERGALKKTASDASCTWSDDKLYCCFSAVALCCPSVGRGWLERLEGVVSSFCLYFFFSIRWIQSRAHGLGSVFGPRDVLLLLPFLFLSAGMDTGSSRDVTPRERGGARL